MLYSRILQLYTFADSYTYRMHIDAIIKTSDTVLRKICTSLFIERIRKGLLKVLLWEGIGDRTELQHIDPRSYGHQRCLSRSPGLLNRRPEGPAFCWLSLPHLVSNFSGPQLTKASREPLLPGSGFLYYILSLTYLISNSLGVPRAPSARWWLSLPHLVSDFSDLQLDRGFPEAPSAGWWLFLPHLVSNSSDLQLTDFLSSLSYIIVQSPTQCLFSWLARLEYATSGIFGLACLIIIKWK